MVASFAEFRHNTTMMNQQVIAQIRSMRAYGLHAFQIARSLGVSLNFVMMVK